MQALFMSESGSGLVQFIIKSKQVYLQERTRTAL